MKTKTIKIVTLTSLCSGCPLVKEDYLSNLEQGMDWARGFLTMSLFSTKNVLQDLDQMLQNAESNFVVGFDGKEKPDPEFKSLIKQIKKAMERTKSLGSNVFVDVEN